MICIVLQNDSLPGYLALFLMTQVRKDEIFSLIAQEAHHLADKMCSENAGTVSDVTCVLRAPTPSPPALRQLFFKAPCCLPATTGSSPLNQKDTK